VIRMRRAVEMHVSYLHFQIANDDCQLSQSVVDCNDKGMDLTDLVALPPYSRRSDESETESSLLLWIVDIAEDKCVAGEYALDFRFEERHFQRGCEGLERVAV